jgi:hypothetical protein
MCLLLGSIDGADLRGGNDLDTQGVVEKWRTHAEVAEAMGHRILAFHLRGEIRNNNGGAVVLRCRGPPPLNSKALFWRDDYAVFVSDVNTRADRAYRAMRLEWRVYVAQCSRRARLELMMGRASPAMNPAIQGAVGLVLPPDAVSCVMAFVLPAHYRTRAGPPAAGPRLALVACTLAYNLMKVIEGLNGTDISPIMDVQQIAAEGDCDVLVGYCEFLRDWWR